MNDEFDADDVVAQSAVGDLIDEYDLAMVVVGSLDPKPSIGSVADGEKEYQVSVKTYKVSQDE